MNSRYLFVIIFCMSIGSVSAENFYLGLNVGVADQSGDFSISDKRLNSNVGITEAKDYLFPQENTDTYNLLAGYKLGADMGFEIGVASNSEVEGISRSLSATETALEKIESNYIYAAFIGVWPLQNGWAISGRLGFSVWDINYTQTVTDTAVPADVLREETLSDTTAANFIGLGLSYGVTPDIELKWLVEQHHVDFAFTNVNLDGSILLSTIGFAYHF